MTAPARCCILLAVVLITLGTISCRDNKPVSPPSPWIEQIDDMTTVIHFRIPDELDYHTKEVYTFVDHYKEKNRNKYHFLNQWVDFVHGDRTHSPMIWSVHLIHEPCQCVANQARR